MLGEQGTEQFTIITRQDGKIIREQKIHDPFLWCKTTIGISRWDLLKAMFRKQFTTTVEVQVRGTEGVMRAIMTLDPAALDRETETMLAARKLSREKRSNSGNCYRVGMEDHAALAVSLGCRVTAES